MNTLDLRECAQKNTTNSREYKGILHNTHESTEKPLIHQIYGLRKTLEFTGIYRNTIS